MALQIEVRTLASPHGILLRDLELDIAPGSIHTLMGDSGSGKSSLLAAVCGTLDPAMRFEGSITLDGRRIDQLPTQARRVGILFQDALLFPHMTVQENLLFAVPRGPSAERHAQVQQALLDMEISELREADPGTLSGGQRARVALARALLAQPQALLLDEPFSRLDSALRVRMRELVFGVVRARNIPALLVTHDMQDVADASQITAHRRPMSGTSDNPAQGL